MVINKYLVMLICIIISITAIIATTVANIVIITVRSFYIGLIYQNQYNPPVMLWHIYKLKTHYNRKTTSEESIVSMVSIWETRNLKNPLCSCEFYVDKIENRTERSTVHQMSTLQDPASRDYSGGNASHEMEVASHFFT